MNNLFISEYFDWKQAEPSRRVQLANRILSKIGFLVRLAPPPCTDLMPNTEQRINMFHLSSQVLVHGVRGDFVELGCHEGQSAVSSKE